MTDIVEVLGSMAKNDPYSELPLLEAADEIKRLRGLLYECLSFAMQAPIGVSSDLWEKVTKELGND
jgi:hypothetical protein